MHNGSVEEFRKIKRELVNQLSDESFLAIHGTTDSEHLFALFRDHLSKHADSEPMEAMAAVMQDTIESVNRLTAEGGRG